MKNMTQVGNIQVAPENETVNPSWSYATKKTVAKGMLNTALLISNAAQLKALFKISTSDRDGFWYTQMVFVILSLVLQVIAAVLLLVLGMKKPKTTNHALECERMNNASVALVLIITILNIVISAFGMQLTTSL